MLGLADGTGIVLWAWLIDVQQRVIHIVPVLGECLGLLLASVQYSLRGSCVTQYMDVDDVLVVMTMLYEYCGESDPMQTGCLAYLGASFHDLLKACVHLAFSVCWLRWCCTSTARGSVSQRYCGNVDAFCIGTSVHLVRIVGHQWICYSLGLFQLGVLM